MKTSNNFKMRNGISVLSLMITSLLLLGSCQKDELAQPGAANSTTDKSVANSRPAFAVNPGPAQALVFATIKIDHIAARTTFPDYSVTVNSNGTVLYEGRRNVAVKGQVQLRISSATLFAINDVCKAINFYAIKDVQPDIPDLPFVATSYSGSSYSGRTVSRIKTLVDYNNGYPASLITFRTKIESKLDLNKLIGTIVIDILPIDQ